MRHRNKDKSEGYHHQTTGRGILEKVAWRHDKSVMGGGGGGGIGRLLKNQDWMEGEPPQSESIEASRHPVLLPFVEQRWPVTAADAMFEFESGVLDDSDDMKNGIDLVDRLQSEQALAEPNRAIESWQHCDPTRQQPKQIHEVRERHQ